MSKDEHGERSEMTIPEIQSEVGKLMSDLEKIGARTLELRDMLPGDEKYPREMHEGKVCPTLEYELHGWLGLTAKEDIEEAIQHMRYAAELTEEEVRQSWEERRSEDDKTTLYLAFRRLGMRPPKDLAGIDRCALSEKLRERVEVLIRRSEELSEIADSLQPEAERS